MPFKSKAQMKMFYAKESRGELPSGTAKEWAHKTKSIKSLPEHVVKSPAHDGTEHKKAFWKGRKNG